MSAENRPEKGETSDADRQFQTDITFLPHKARTEQMKRGFQAFADVGDLSLAMRQFNQSPANSNG